MLKQMSIPITFSVKPLSQLIMCLINECLISSAKRLCLFYNFFLPPGPKDTLFVNIPALSMVQCGLKQ